MTELPIDEMLLDLRSALEIFNDDPSHESFADIQTEMRRIEWHCEELIEDDQ